MDCVVGIDIGHSSGNKPTTGLVLLEQAKVRVRFAGPVGVDDIGAALAQNLSEGDRINTAVVDGPLAQPHVLRNQRLCEQFFSSGAFSSSGKASLKLRLMPGPTGIDSRLLNAALSVANMLMSQPFNVPRFCFQAPVRPSVVEIFPTLFMAALLPPKPYDGNRGSHTDSLWAQLWGENSGQPLPALNPYCQLQEAVQNQPNKKARHEVRAAAICAMAAHAISVGGHFGFIGTADERGFLLPGTRDHLGWMHPEFYALLSEAWEGRPDTRNALQWI